MTNTKISPQRDNYIDLIKALAAISVIFIHTVHNSGNSYSPYLLQCLSLFFDVPVFFLLAGIVNSGNMTRTVKSLAKLFVSFGFFTLIIFVLEIVINNPDSIKELANYIFRFRLLFPATNSQSTFFTSFYYSTWFMDVYFVVILAAAIFLSLAKRIEVKILTAVLLISIILTTYFIEAPQLFAFTTFYLFIFLLGYLSKKLKLKTSVFFILLAVLAILFFTLGSIYMPYFKFPPTFVYLIGSSFSILFILFFKSKIKVQKSNYLTYLGQNALFLYFAQGISSSILYIIVPKVLAWGISPIPMVFMMFIINLTMALLILEIIRFLDQYLWKGIRFIRSLYN